MKREPFGPARVDMMPLDGIIGPDQLLDVDPVQRWERRRQAILRAGGSPGSGWLFGSIHAEYEIQTGMIHLHEHILAAGSCLTAIDSMRRQRNFKHPRAIQITREPLTDLPRPLSYLRQGFWPARDRRFASPRRRRVPEPAHSLMLLWMDRHPVNAFELMIGLRVIGDRLVVR